jgi:hypothetical protein
MDRLAHGAINFLAAGGVSRLRGSSRRKDQNAGQGGKEKMAGFHHVAEQWSKLTAKPERWSARLLICFK